MFSVVERGERAALVFLTSKEGERNNGKKRKKGWNELCVDEGGGEVSSPTTVERGKITTFDRGGGDQGGGGKPK